MSDRRLGTAIVWPVAFHRFPPGILSNPLGSTYPTGSPASFHFNWRSASIGDRVKGSRSLKATSTGPTEIRGHAFNPGRRRIHAILGLLAVACLARRALAG